MDDSCAVCAETLEWVAYGPCGHKDVCSNCVVRLRFICDDRHCCICKDESNVVFVTKALGDYTRTLNNFSVLPSQAHEGRVGSYWYHEDTQAYFDDLDHYKMIKAMCKLSCSICDKTEGQPPPGDGSRRRGNNNIRTIEQLKGHLFHQHRLLMCSLCLEGRKIFICEQKLYTRAQLNQHRDTGDSVVDGTESERGGFMGHPKCEFCRTAFYGENELYTHMSTDHYTCHICQRQNPGQYEYYRNYEDLEGHFRQGHFLCEDEACLAKKFVVFQSEAEMKRHSTLEHGGRMSRSQRSAALQIPTSFQYRRSNEHDNRRGRGRGRGRAFRPNRSDVDLSMAIEASLETSNNTDVRVNNNDPSNTPVVSNYGDSSDIDPLIQPFESLATTDSAPPPSRYLQAASNNSRHGPLQESSFPPLVSTAPDASQQRPRPEPEGLPRNTMVEHLRRQNNRTGNFLNSTTQARPAAMPTNTQAWRALPSRAPVTPEIRPPANIAPGPSSSSSSQSRPAMSNAPTTPSCASLTQARPASVNNGPSLSSSSSSSLRNWGNSNSNSRMSHSTSAPNLVGSDFPLVSAVQTRKPPASSQPPAVPNVEDAKIAANNALVERIRASLAFDADKFAAIREKTIQYRHGKIDASIYLTYVEEFGLTHLIFDLANMCPETEKQRELIETYNANSMNNFKKAKGKSTDNFADNIISTVSKLQQSSYRPLEDEVETLSKDGYRAVKGKKVIPDELQTVVNSSNQPMVIFQGKSQPVDGGSNTVRREDGGDGNRNKQQRKKTTKFHRARLGDGSMAALLDMRNSDADPEPDPDLDLDLDGNNSGEVIPVRGVWRNGGGHKLMAKTSRK